MSEGRLPEINNRRVAAIVVTYNRRELLHENLKALLAQSRADELQIVVVDNDSTDGTAELMEAYADNEIIHYFNTGSNLGGAGGFGYGMRQAVRLGCEFFWLMDDDCIPDPWALEAFLRYEDRCHGQYGFLSSMVLWTDGRPAKMNVQRETLTHDVTEWNRNEISVAMASFVSLWVPRHIVEQVGLPIKEFFIWTDDWEFTRRISRRYQCWLITDSVVTHKCISNTGADISTAELNQLERFRYLYRNDVYLYRREGIRGLAYEAIRLGGHSLKVLLKSRDARFRRIGIILGSTVRGLFFRPGIEKLET